MIKEKVQQNYQDVTEEWLTKAKPNSHRVKNQNYFETVDGKKYYVDGKNVVLDYSEKEKEIAVWLENTFGGEIYMLPRINKPDGIQTSDYFWKNEYWDLKEINECGKNILFHAIEDHRLQTCNFIFDLSKTSLTNFEIIDRINKLYNIKKVNWLDKIILKRNNQLILITKRSSPSD